MSNCYLKSREHWFPNAKTRPTAEPHDNNYTICCHNWDTVKCLLNFNEKVCTREELKELEPYMKNFLNFHESKSCNLWPFKEHQKLCYK